MPDLNFQIENVEPQRGTLTPHLVFRLRVTELSGTAIHTVVLGCQAHIEPARRRYIAREEDRLLDLFGTPDRWGQTLRHMLWAQVNVVVPSFVGATTVDLPVPCSYDFCQASTKYFDALDDGEAPLCFLFNGTIFYNSPNNSLHVAQIPWEKEATFRLPIAVWREMMERYYPNCVWLRLRKDLFDQLSRYRSHRGLPTWEQALEKLLAAEEAVT